MINLDILRELMRMLLFMAIPICLGLEICFCLELVESSRVIHKVSDSALIQPSYAATVLET